MDAMSIGVSIIKLVNKIRYAVVDIKIDPAKKDYAPLPVNLIRAYNSARLLGPQKYICHAPFVNMYFGVDGNVTACCYNRNFPFGNIRTNTLDEMWRGEAAQNLRAHIKHYDFTQGCEKCELGIRSGSFNMVEAGSYDRLSPGKAFEFPKRMVFELSGTCNLACKMCNGMLSSTYRRYYENEAPYPDVYSPDFIDQLKPFLKHIQHTNFLGGEPFLIDLYYDIWEYLLKVNKRCKMHIQTNGLVLNNRVKSLLERGRFHIGVSIDSLEEKKFENIRKFGNFKRWMENLEYFRAYTKKQHTDLSIVLTPMTDNMYEVPAFLKFSNKLNAYLYLNTLSEPEEMAIESQDLVELKNYIAFLKDNEIPEPKNFIEKANLKVFRSFISQVEYLIKIKSITDEEEKAKVEEENRNIRIEEKRIQDRLMELRDVPFERIKEILKQKMIREYELSNDYGKFNIDLFLEEFENKVSEEYNNNPAGVLDKLKNISLLEGEQYFANILPYIRESLSQYKIVG